MTRHVPMRNTVPIANDPSFFASFSASVCVYRLSMDRLLWPVMLATLPSCRPPRRAAVVAGHALGAAAGRQRTSLRSAAPPMHIVSICIVYRICIDTGEGAAVESVRAASQNLHSSRSARIDFPNSGKSLRIVFQTSDKLIVM